MEPFDSVSTFHLSSVYQIIPESTRSVPSPTARRGKRGQRQIALGSKWHSTLSVLYTWYSVSHHSALSEDKVFLQVTVGSEIRALLGLMDLVLSSVWSSPGSAYVPGSTAIYWVFVAFITLSERHKHHSQSSSCNGTWSFSFYPN